VRGSESGIYSHKVRMYVVRTYVRGGSRSGMSHGMSLHTGYTIGMWTGRPYDFDMCVTQTDTFRYARLRYCLAFFGDGDGGQEHGAIVAWILQHQTASTANSQA